MASFRFARALNLCNHAGVIVHEREHRDNSMIEYSTLIPLHRVQSLRLTPLAYSNSLPSCASCLIWPNPHGRRGEKNKKRKQSRRNGDVWLEDFFGV